MQAIFDSHCHVDLVLEKGRDKGFTLTDMNEHLKENKVDGFVQIAADPEAIDFAQTFLRENPEMNLYYTIGQHPSEAHEIDINIGIERAKQAVAAGDEKLKAIGEIGLDYYYGADQKQAQIIAFEKYLECALELNLPICIHTRDAHDDTFSRLKQVSDQIRVLIHCFTGNKTQMEDYLSIGCYISFSGIVTFKNAKENQEAALHCPLDRILVETDAPFLTPTPHRGKLNHPAMVRHTLNFIADLKGAEADTLALATYENTKAYYDFE